MASFRFARRAAISILLGASLGFGCVSAVALPAAADSCTPAYRTLADTAMTRAFVCQKVAEETIRGPAGPVHVTYWRRKKDNPAAYPAALESLRRRVAATIRLAVAPYEAFAPLPSDIAVVIGEGLGPWQTGEEVLDAGIANEEFDTRLNSEQCTIDLNMNNLHEGRSGADYRHFVDWVAAHELFHCLQALNFPEPWREAQSKFQTWWIEGMAEYFPALILHDHPILELWRGFGSESAHRSLFEAGYPRFHGYVVAPFFAYLDGPEFGSRRMLEIWKNMPATNSWDVQLAQFQAFRFGPTLQNFAKAVADGSIPTRIPGMPTYGVDALGPQMELDQDDVLVGFARDRATLAPIRDAASASREAFHIYRGRVRLAQGYRYKLTPIVAGDMHLSMREEGLGPARWTDAPAALDADACAHATMITAAATLLEINSRTGPHMRIRRTACTTGGAVDPCELAQPADIEGIVGAPLGGEGSFRRPQNAFPWSWCHLEPRMKFAERFKNPKDPTATPGHRERPNVRSVTIIMTPPQGHGKLGVETELKMATGTYTKGPAWAPNPPLEEIRGLGEKAYYAGTLAVLDRGWLISVSVTGPDSIANSGPDDKAQEIAIAHLLISHFNPP